MVELTEGRRLNTSALCTVICEVLRELLPDERIDPSSSFADIGVNSFRLLLAYSSLQEKLGQEIPADVMLRAGSIHKLARSLDNVGVTCDRMPKRGINVAKCPPLKPSPPANRFSYFIRKLKGFERWAISPIHITVRRDLSSEKICNAVLKLVQRHDGLTLRVSVIDDDIQQTFPEVVDLDDYVVMLPNSGEYAYALDDPAAARDLMVWSFAGALFRVAIQRTTSGWELLVGAHHLVLDALSTSLVLRDLIRGLTDDDPLPYPRSIGFRDYCGNSIPYWRKQRSQAVNYWQSFPWHDIVRGFAVDPRDSANIEGQSQRSVCRLPMKTYERIGRSLSQYEFKINDALILAVAKAYTEHFSSSGLALGIDVVFHGREMTSSVGNVSETVGWISETIPMFAYGDGQIRQQLEYIRLQREHALMNGKAYGVARYICKDPVLAELPEPRVSLNFLPTDASQFPHSDWISVKRLPGDPGDPQTQRVYLLSAGAYVQEQAFVLSWDYSDQLFDSALIKSFTESCLCNLEIIGETFERGNA